MKKAILVVSFGTSYIDTLKKTIEKVEDRIRDEFKEYDIFRAFTSHMIIRSLKAKEGISVKTPGEALEQLYRDGYEEVILQPLHIMPGEEYHYVMIEMKKYKDKFKSIELGRPALYYQGIEHLPQDYDIFIDAIKPLIAEDGATLFMGHGTAHPANSCYGCLQNRLIDLGYNNVFIGTVEGYPTLEDAEKRLNGHKKVTLAPLMLVAGDHARNDMAGDEEDSWKTILEEKGYEVEVKLVGLGELNGIQEMYVNHIKDTISGEYKGEGQTKKGR